MTDDSSRTSSDSKSETLSGVEQSSEDESEDKKQNCKKKKQKFAKKSESILISVSLLKTIQGTKSKKVKRKNRELIQKHQIRSSFLSAASSLLAV